MHLKKKFKYLSEFEFTFEKALFSPLIRAHRAQDGCFNKKKTERVENLVTLSLSTHAEALMKRAFISAIFVFSFINFVSLYGLTNIT
jgi:hypothetical protein